MYKNFTIYITVLAAIFALAFFAGASGDNGFRGRMLDFINKTTKVDKKNSESTITDENVFLLPDIKNQNNYEHYKKGDWPEYVQEQAYRKYLAQQREGNIYSDENVDLNTYGSVSMNAKYGKSYYTSNKYYQYDEDKPKSRVISEGFMPEQVILMHMEGKIGDRITVFIDHDSRRKDNHYLMNYKAISDDEVIREINIGEIDIKFNHSHYAVYDNTDQKGLGADITVAKGNFSMKAFASISKGETAIEYFNGNSSPGDSKISEYQYVRKTYYQLEPFIRYDNVSTMPSGSSAYNLITFTSNLSNTASYALTSVNINTSGFELYIDDQISTNNYNAITLSLDNGYYTKMVNGSDYSINYTSGIITLLKTIPDNARIFAVYNRNGGTLDPCALSSSDSQHPGGAFAGKILVFIKYGNSINEDTVTKNLSFDTGEIDVNNDGKVNLDIYEIRSIYYLGAKNIQTGSFTLKFYNENQIMSNKEISNLSNYKINFTDGLIAFTIREPFKHLFSSDVALKIYSEASLTDTYLNSKYRIYSSYNIDMRSFQLKHTNIIEKSVRIKINEREISSSLYSVDYLSGYINFTNSNNPVIGSDTKIEVKYEYLPSGMTAQNFVGGIRGDYNINKSLRIGGSVIMSRGTEGLIAPNIGSESTQTLVFEGDASLKLSEAKLAELYNIFALKKRKSVPLQFSAYGEYAKSYRNVNIFGKALIENMETSNDIVSLSLSEKDWILSSMPSALTQNDRGIIKYYFYRDPESPDKLKGSNFNAASVNYAAKPGPYNIAMGHVNNNIKDSDSQRSLVFNFDFTSGSCIAVASRNFTSNSIDLSGMQYIELWMKYEGSATDYVDLYIDLGSISEDSDGDGILETEDANHNGYIDSNASSEYSEDRGYVFHGNTPTVVGSGPALSSSTKGDGILNTEDLNGNGVLDTLENVYTIHLGTVGVNGGSWQKVKVFIDQSTMTDSQIQLLQTTKYLRFYLKQNTGTSGKLYIDCFNLVSSKWKKAALDGSATSNINRIKISTLNTVEDSDYRSESFLIKESGVYQSLYGKKSDSDTSQESETTLQIEYDIPSINNNVSITRTFTKDIDIRFYKTLNLWINPRVINSTNKIGFIFGSSSNDYFEYQITPKSTLNWSEIKLKLQNSSAGDYTKTSITGTPDMKRIKYMKVVIYGPGTTGKIWLDEIYVSEPETVEGDAHWYECELTFTQPFFKTATGTPVISDMNIKYVNKGNSSQFSAVNKTSSDISENYNEIFSSMRILPNWNMSMDYIYEQSKTDSLNTNVTESKRGDTKRDLFVLNSAFISTGGMVPNISLSYTIDKNVNQKEITTDDNKYNEATNKIIHTPVITYNQIFNEFLFGKLVTTIKLDMAFTDNNTHRNSNTLSYTDLANYVAINEQTKTQKSQAAIDFDYTNKFFYLKPKLGLYSQEYVEMKGVSNSSSIAGVSGNINGDFHLPFVNNSNMKYTDRDSSTGITLGLKCLEYFSPEYNMSMNYKENSFSDYTDNTVDNRFSRSKKAITTLSTGLKIPIEIRKIKIFENIRNCQISYKRSLVLNESNVPYEGEKTDLFDEKYGFSRTLSGLSDIAYNLFTNYPGIFFTGRGNYERGRDVIYTRFNNNYGIPQINSSSTYDNSLRIQDTFSTDIFYNKDFMNLTLTGSLNQVSERTNIYGIPNQVITESCGLSMEFDLMKIFRFGFFRKNTEGQPYHASIFSIGISYTDSMLITYNIDEKKITPTAGITFKWDRSSFGIKGEFDYRKKTNKEFISTDLTQDDSDYKYLENMSGNISFKEEDFGYKFSTLYETDVNWLYNICSEFYKLSGIPIFSIEYSMEINRYDYIKTVSPEPYDCYILKTGLTLNMHKNIQGNITGKFSLEQYRNRDDNGISREVVSYEFLASLSLIF